MMGLPMSKAAIALLRGLIKCSGVPRDRILLSGWRSIDWQSLTFIGERHEIELRIAGSDSGAVARRLKDNIAEAEFDIGGHLVADIEVIGEPWCHPDGSTSLSIEALTVAT